MMPRTLSLAAALLLAATPALPTADASSCSGSVSGFSPQTGTCAFSCDAGDGLGVSASIDQGGTVTVAGECGGASASCTTEAGWCSSVGGPAPSAGTGGCSATGTGTLLVSFSFSCWTEPTDGGKGAAREDFDPARLRGVSTRTPGLEALLTPEAGRTFHVLGGEGGVAGYACTPLGCVAVAPACVASPGAWTCRV